MENVSVRPRHQQSNYPAAPYAESVIPLFLASVSGMRYRTLNCMECGIEIIERNNDMLYRLNDETMPPEIHINGESVPVRCGNCQQLYMVQVSIDVTYEAGGPPLHMQPQSVYLMVDVTKKLRYLHCLECGKPFHSISDRIRQVIDNRIPFNLLASDKIGPVESLCPAQHCGQTWALMF